jgi:hypothetical protein
MVLTNKEEPTLKPSSSKLGTCWGHYYGTLAYQTPSEANVWTCVASPSCTHPIGRNITSDVSNTKHFQIDLLSIFYHGSNMKFLQNSKPSHASPTHWWVVCKSSTLFAFKFAILIKCARRTWSGNYTMIFSVAYYLKLCNIRIVYCASNFNQKRLNWLFEHYITSTSLLGKNLH